MLDPDDYDDGGAHKHGWVGRMVEAPITMEEQNLLFQCLSDSSGLGLLVVAHPCTPPSILFEYEKVTSDLW